MPFGSLGVRPQPIVEQQIPNYAQWDWDFAGKAQKSMESTHKMTQDAQNQPLLREKQSIENQIERALFEPKLNEMTAKIEQMKADTNYRNSMAQYTLGRAQAETAMVTGRGSLGTFQPFLSLYDDAGAGTASGGTAGAGAGQVTNGVDWGFKTGVSR
jgi:hypothetical protein